MVWGERGVDLTSVLLLLKTKSSRGFSKYAKRYAT